ncbi:MAG: CBS domain-containing protein [Nitrososphaerota archaeon]|nr:CBS domain-containing protein [Nitrososphaerota archaeon]
MANVCINLVAMLNVAVRVKAFMRREMISIDSKRTIKEAVKRMVRYDIGSIVITNHGNPVGIVTERDVLRRALMASKRPNRPVKEIMSSPLITIDSLATIGEVAELMSNRDIRRVLVTENDKVVGIITQRDVQKALLDTFNTLIIS